jgi:hypothetical protein
MSDNGTEFNTPVGRVVWGHPLEPREKMKDGAKVLKDGMPVKQWSFGVAFIKPEFEAQMWPHLASETAKMYSNGVPPNFSYKYKDGDDSRPTWNNGKQGKPLSERPGHAGHYILTITTELQAPSVVRFDNGVYKEVLSNQIKCGDYVAMTLIAKVHGGETPGLYINPGVVVHAFEGDAIAGGGFDIDPTQSFGAAPQFAMPAGARPLGAPAPVGGMPGAAPGGMPAYAPPATQPQYTPPLAQPGQMPGAAPMAAPAQQPTFVPPQAAAPAPSGMMPGGMPGQMPPPAHDFVQNAGMPTAMPGQMPGVAPGMMPGAMPPGAMPGPR